MRPPEHEPTAGDAVAAVPPQIQHHARAVSELADRVELAWHTTAGITFNVSAYGQICVFLPRALSSLQEGITRTTKLAAEAVERMSTALTTVSDGYVAADEEAATRHQALLTEHGA